MEDDLPPGWVVQHSKSRPDMVYYYNTNTGESVWEKPQAKRVTRSEALKRMKGDTSVPTDLSESQTPAQETLKKKRPRVARKRKVDESSQSEVVEIPSSSEETSSRARKTSSPAVTVSGCISDKPAQKDSFSHLSEMEKQIVFSTETVNDNVVVGSKGPKEKQCQKKVSADVTPEKCLPSDSSAILSSANISDCVVDLTGGDLNVPVETTQNLLETSGKSRKNKKKGKRKASQLDKSAGSQAMVATMNSQVSSLPSTASSSDGLLVLGARNESVSSTVKLSEAKQPSGSSNLLKQQDSSKTLNVSQEHNTTPLQAKNKRKKKRKASKTQVFGDQSKNSKAASCSGQNSVSTKQQGGCNILEAEQLTGNNNSVFELRQGSCDSSLMPTSNRNTLVDFDDFDLNDNSVIITKETFNSEASVIILDDSLASSEIGAQSPFVTNIDQSVIVLGSPTIPTGLPTQTVTGAGGGDEPIDEDVLMTEVPESGSQEKPCVSFGQSEDPLTPQPRPSAPDTLNEPRDIEDMDTDEDCYIIFSNLHEVRNQTADLGTTPVGDLTRCVFDGPDVSTPSKVKLEQEPESPVKPKEDLMLVVDTNVFISNLNFLQSMLNTDLPEYGKPTLVLPWVVIQELDKIKDSRRRFHANQDVVFRAIKAVHFIHTNLSQKNPYLVGQTPKEAMAESDLIHVRCPDDRILICCLQWIDKCPNDKVVLLTRDVNMRNKAMISSITTADNNTIWQVLNLNPNCTDKKKKTPPVSSLDKVFKNQPINQVPKPTTSVIEKPNTQKVNTDYFDFVLRKFDGIYQFVLKFLNDAKRLINNGRNNISHVDSVKKMANSLAAVVMALERCLVMSPVIISRQGEAFQKLSRSVDTFLFETQVPQLANSPPLGHTLLMNYFSSIKNRPVLFSGLKDYKTMLTQLQTIY